MRMSTLKQHWSVRGPLRECRSIRSGASGLPYYCTPLVCISAVSGLLAVWLHNKPKTKKPWRFTNSSLGLPHAPSLSVYLFLWIRVDVRTTLPICLSSFSICIFLSQIPAYLYVNHDFPPLPYSYTLIAIFICMVCVLFYTSTHLFLSFFCFYKFHRHLCHGAYWCTHNPARIPVLFFHLYLHLTDIWTYKYINTIICKKNQSLVQWHCK